MKKLILLALTAVVIAGCEYENKNKSLSEYTVKGSNIKCVVIDSCEYIVNEERYAYAYTESCYETYTHRGNCKFCKERRKQELKELIRELKGE